jgi:hypothetical protein
LHRIAAVTPPSPADPRPEQVNTTAPGSLETGELGSEGGSYGELIQAAHPQRREADSGFGGNPALWWAIAIFVATLLIWLLPGLI